MTKALETDKRAEKIAEMMQSMSDEDKNIVLIYAGALRDRGLVAKRKKDDPDEPDEEVAG